MNGYLHLEDDADQIAFIKHQAFSETLVQQGALVSALRDLRQTQSISHLPSQAYNAFLAGADIEAPAYIPLELWNQLYAAMLEIRPIYQQAAADLYGAIAEIMHKNGLRTELDFAKRATRERPPTGYTDGTSMALELLKSVKEHGMEAVERNRASLVR